MEAKAADFSHYECSCIASFYCTYFASFLINKTKTKVRLLPGLRMCTSDLPDASSNQQLHVKVDVTIE